MHRFKTCIQCVVTAVCLAAIYGELHAEENQPPTKPTAENIWPQGVPDGKPLDIERLEKDDHVWKVRTPTITIHRPAPDKANGAAVVICPGGGYGVLAIEKEGHDIARWFNTFGVMGIVLEYRLTEYGHPAPREDVQRAIQIVRSRSAELKIDSKRIGVMGFSAGGHLASTAATHFTAPEKDAADPIARISNRPDFAILVYPVISMQPDVTHQGSKNNLRGKDPEADLMAAYSNELRVTKDTPRALLVHTRDDWVKVENSRLFFAALQKHDVPAKLLEFEKGGHGYGLGIHGGEVAKWPAQCQQWLAEQGLLVNPSAAAGLDVPRLAANYDEAKVPQYTLPSLTLAGDTQINAMQWQETRRGEILRMFETQMFGQSPAAPAEMKFEVTESDSRALGGKAIRKQITIHLSDQSDSPRIADGPRIDVLIYLPANAKGPVPLFVGMNFYGNHTIHTDPAIHLARGWVRNNKDFGITANRATEASRGKRTSRWPVEMILEQGYGLATIYCGDVDPDNHDSFQNGVHGLFDSDGKNRTGASWGSIAAWAWGLSRAMDYFETNEDIDHERIAVIGHSRLGKTALWAGASDERFALVVSNDSGCGGAALSKRKFGETVHIINSAFPHWFCGNFKQYNDNEAALPFDQHMLIALMAPRPVYVASAAGDRWADPRGEFLAAKNASPVYEAYGLEGLPVEDMPSTDNPVMGTIGYHVRSGKHDITTYDWQQYLTFADMHFLKSSIENK